MPCFPSADRHTWCRIVDLGYQHLPELDLARLREISPEPAPPIANEQTPDSLAAEAETVAAASPLLAWRRPSDHDPDQPLVAEATVDPASETAEVVIGPNPGRLRGIVLHKLMEELLNGELDEDENTVTARADVLLQQIAGAEPDATRAPRTPSELANTALRTLRLPEIAALRPGLMPELAVWSESDGALIAGRADAAAYEGGTPSVVVDWNRTSPPRRRTARNIGASCRTT